MTETERRRLWHEARAALSLGGDYTDWPARLALPVIARLHNPEAPAGMLDFLEAEADAGTLPTETHEFQTSRPGRRAATSAYLTGRSNVTAQPPAIEIRRARSAHAADVAALLGASDAGRFLAAWIAPYRAPDEVNQDEAAAPRKVKLKRDFVAEVVERIRAFHAENEKRFDSNCMPGDAGDLLWLMKRLHPDQFEEMELKAFREHYRGVCKWHRCAGQQAGARSLYLEIFPEAKAPLAAVVSLSK